MLKIQCRNEPWNDVVQFALADETGYATVTMAKRELGAVIYPTFSLEREMAQSLMDQLWACGLRPSEGSGSAGALAATQRHLEDMRTLVFAAKGEI